MTFMAIGRCGTSALACCVVLAAGVARADEPTTSSDAFSRPSESAAVARDVELQDGGTLRGQIVNAQGSPCAGVSVTLRSAEQVVTAIIADTSGRFAISGLRGGAYQLETEQGGGAYRLWVRGTAPPAASQSLLVVNGDVVRGQHRHGLVGGGSGHFGGTIMRLLHNPWVVGAGIATAIALPIALDDDDAS